MHKHHSAGVTHLWNMFWQKPFSHGNNNIWFEARLVANINLHISLFSTTNDKPHKIDSFVLNHNAYLNFIIISLLLPSHSYALTSFFDFRLLQHLRHDTKDNFKSLTFIIISLFLPSHSYALTSFFSCFLFSFAFHNIYGMTLKIIHTQYLACSNWFLTSLNIQGRP